MHWEPTIRNPYRGLVVWSLPEILDVDVTLYRSMRASNYEDKEWTLAIEEISPLGRPRRIATANINISNYVDEQFGVPSRHEIFKLSLNLTSKKVKEVFVTLVISTQFLKEGKATYVLDLTRRGWEEEASHVFNLTHLSLVDFFAVTMIWKV